MASPKGSAGEYSFTRAAFDEQADNELHYRVVWEHSILPGAQKGVWVFRTAVYRALRAPNALPIVTQVDEWPNVRTGSFAALWYQHCHKTARMVESFQLDIDRSRAVRQV